MSAEAAAGSAGEPSGHWRWTEEAIGADHRPFDQSRMRRMKEELGASDLD